MTVWGLEVTRQLGMTYSFRYLLKGEYWHQYLPVWISLVSESTPTIMQLADCKRIVIPLL